MIPIILNSGIVPLNTIWIHSMLPPGPFVKMFISGPTLPEEFTSQLFSGCLLNWVDWRFKAMITHLSKDLALQLAHP